MFIVSIVERIGCIMMGLNYTLSHEKHTNPALKNPNMRLHMDGTSNASNIWNKKTTTQHFTTIFSQA